jgi:hypothetical protein
MSIVTSAQPAMIAYLGQTDRKEAPREKVVLTSPKKSRQSLLVSQSWRGL